MDPYSLRLIEEMNRYYEARAPWHDEYMDVRSLEEMTKRFSRILDFIRKYLDGQRVLEIACGTGNWTRLIAPLAASVTAVDNSISSLQIAKPKLAEFDNVRLVQANAYKLDCLNREFDVLFSADFWSHIPKKAIESFLNAASGKLSPGAYSIFLDMSWQTFFQSEKSDLDEDVNRVSLRSLPNGSEFHVVKNFPTEDELREIIRPFGNAIRFTSFPELQRWLVCFRFLN